MDEQVQSIPHTEECIGHPTNESERKSPRAQTTFARLHANLEMKEDVLQFDTRDTISAAMANKRSTDFFRESRMGLVEPSHLIALHGDLLIFPLVVLPCRPRLMVRKVRR